MSGKKPKSLGEHLLEKLRINCPVDVYIYDSSGNQIGFITEDDIEYDDNLIVIERLGDAKIISVISDMGIQIKLSATDYGMLNCSFEEYDGSVAKGRLNYYDINLTPKTKISVDLPKGGFIDNTSNIRMKSENVIVEPDERLTVNDYSAVAIDIQKDVESGGKVCGSGDYVIGDTVNMIASPCSNYAFGGWYESGSLFSLDRNISFIARESKTYTAKFMELKSNIVYEVQKLELSKEAYTYNGKSRKPKVAVTDINGNIIPADYYTISYSNNKKVGKATVTVMLKNGYSGTLKKNFTIKPMGTKLSSFTGKSGSISVEWTRQKTQTTGYQLQYSTNSKFTKKATVTKTVKKNVATKLTAKKLKSGKTYYVRIRTYKIVNGKKYYSAWPKAKKVKTMK